MKIQPALLPILGFSLITPLMAGDVYHRVPFSEVLPAKDPSPAAEPDQRGNGWAMRSSIHPYAVADHPAGTEILLDTGAPLSTGLGPRPEPISVVIRSPEGREVKGRIFVPKADLSGMDEIPFTLSSKAEPTGAAEFYRVREIHAAWFLGGPIGFAVPG